MRQFLLAAFAALVLAACATADDVVVPVVVRSGSLALAPTGTAATGSRVSTTVVDARGRGGGWTLSVRSAGLTAGSLVVAGVELGFGPRSTCTLPRSDIRYPILLNPLRLTPVLRALPGSGLGATVVTLEFSAPARLGTAFRFTVRPS